MYECERKCMMADLGACGPMDIALSIMALFIMIALLALLVDAIMSPPKEDKKEPVKK